MKKNKVDSKKKSFNSTIFLLVVSLITFAIATVGSSFAFFTFVIKGNNRKDFVDLQTTDIVLQTDGVSINEEGIYPGWEKVTEFSITNKSSGNIKAEYSVLWDVIQNDINNDSFVYSIDCTSYKDGKVISLSENNKVPSNLSNLVVPTVSTSLGKGIIESGVTHKCKLTLTFKETGEDQNELQDKVFKANIVPSGKTL